MTTYLCKLEHDDYDEWYQLDARHAVEAVEDYCQYLYNNCDGWEWMPRTEKNRVEVKVAGSDEITVYEWTLDFDPIF